jgi:hypothetical protein
MATTDEVADLFAAILSDAEYSREEHVIIGGNRSTPNPDYQYAMGWTHGITDQSAVMAVIANYKGMPTTSYHAVPTDHRHFNQGAWLVVDDTAAPAPEPSTFVLLVAGLVGLAAAYRRRRK